MKALVLGGTGFLGVATCKELMRRGVETIAASRTPAPYGTFTSHRAFDRKDEAQLSAVLGATEPDVLVDLAAYQAADVEAVIRQFKGERYLFISTGTYPDDHGGTPAKEEAFVPMQGAVPSEELEYRDGKRWCETVLMRTPDFPWTIIRPPAVLGAADHTLRVAAYLQRVEDGGPLLVPAETYQRQAGLAWVRDVGYLCALASDLRRPAARRSYNVAFEGVSIEGFLRGLGRAMGREVVLVPVPYAELMEKAPASMLYGPDPNRSAGYDLTRSRAELGFEPSELEDALAEILAWYRGARPEHPGYASRPVELEIAAAIRAAAPPEG